MVALMEAANAGVSGTLAPFREETTALVQLVDERGMEAGLAAVPNVARQFEAEEREAAVGAAGYVTERGDLALPEGTRICVAGRGRGTYTSFGKKTFGANEHTIAFDSGETVVVKLMQEEWTVKETDMDAMDPPPRPMSITVTTLEQRRIPLEVPWTTKVEAVQAMIEQDHGIPAARQRLLFNREPLFDDWTLQRCGVEDGADLGLVLRLADSTTQAPRWLRMLEDPARYPLHAAAQDGRLTDLIAKLRAKQAEGTIAAGTPCRAHPTSLPFSPACCAGSACGAGR